MTRHRDLDTGRRANAAAHSSRILARSETLVQEHPRVHLDSYAGDAADQAAEAERLAAVGAERVDRDRYGEDPGFVVLADTEGNRFCVIDTGGHA